MKNNYSHVEKEIASAKKLTEEIESELIKAIEEFLGLFK